MRLWTQVTLKILMLYKVCSNPNAQANTEGSTEPSISIGAYEFVSNVPEEFRRHFVLTEGGRKVLFQPGESRCSRVVKWLEETFRGNVAMISGLITCNMESCHATSRGGRPFCGRNALGHTRYFGNKCHQCAAGCKDLQGGGTRYVTRRQNDCRVAEQECKALSCASNSPCVYTETGYVCHCPAGFQGNTCEVNVDECASSPCRNGATCVDNINGYECNCATGFQGTNCNMDVDECASFPCQNGATCLDNINGYECNCATGFQGTNCDTDVDECASFPCRNGATCLDNINGYECNCATGFQGTNYVDECASFPCRNGATCLDNINGYECNCVTGFQGINCVEDIDECASSPCQNEATCRDMVNGYTCNCAPGFEGSNCETSSKPELRVSLQGSHTNPDLGDRVTVRCDASDVSVPIRWYKDGLQLETDLYDDLFVLSSAILILEFDYIHQGEYSCRASREEDGAIAEVDFTFRLPLELQFATYPRNIKILQYSDGVLHCSPVNRLHVVRWEKDGVPLRMNEHVFQVFDDILIVDATEREAGLYTCVLYSGSHRIREVAAYVTVDILPTVNRESRASAEALFSTYPENTTILQFGDHVLPCSPVDSSHVVIWEKDGAPLELNGHLSMELGDNILIANATLHQTGMYTCVLYSGYQRIKEISAHVTVVARQEKDEICGTISAEEAVGTDGSAGTGRSFRIVRGQTAVHGSSPWIARLYDISDRAHFCAGSIVSNLWIISAAHCIIQSGVTVNTLMIRLGDYDVLVTDDSESLLGVAQIIIPDGFNEYTFDQDIALIRLSTPMNFTDYLRPICMPNITLARKLYKAGTEGKVAGWGRIEEAGPLPRYLTEVNLPLVGKRRCRASTNYTVTTNMFCAGYPRESGDACTGDTGSPFAVDFQGRWYLLGITSWGEGCGQEGKYGFYTRVSKLLDWTNSYIHS